MDRVRVGQFPNPVHFVPSSKPLVICEKPSMAKAVFEGLGGGQRHGGYFETDEFLIVPAVGHILEQADPEAYGAPRFPGTKESLPIRPKEWIVMPVADKKAQVNLIKKLWKDAPWIVNSGDPDREGQMIIDELLDFFGNRKPVKRVLLPDVTPKTVRKSFQNLEDNAKYAGRYAAALGRSRADWLVGMNMSRAMSIQGRAQGYFGTLSVGRIQTPTLAIVVNREREIRDFKPTDHFSIQAQMGGADVQPSFWAKWLPPGLDPDAAFAKSVAPEDMTEEQEAAQAKEEEAALAAGGAGGAAPRLPYLDEANRLIDGTFAQKVANEIKGAGQATVTKDERKEATEPAPLLFELNSISTAVERLFGMSGSDTLKACQSLYQNGYQSYPRTDSGFLPEALREQVPEVLAAIAQADAGLGALMGPADPNRDSRVWNDDKTKVHYGLIPTTVVPNLATLTQDERNVYLTVARQYLAQFYPDCIVDKAMIELDAAGHRLVARGRVVKSPGWRVLFSAQAVADDEKADDEDGVLPKVSVGQSIGVLQVKVNSHRTTPPNRYTEGSLKSVMKHVARLVTDPKQKKMLRMTEGIGTAATRIPMIKTLLTRGLLVKKGKHLAPALIAEVLVDAVPALLTSPALTAQWEMALELIEQGKLSLAQFEAKQDDFLNRLLLMAEQKPLPPLPAAIMEEARAKTAKKFGGKTGGKAFAPRPAGPPATAVGPVPAGEGKPCPTCKKGTLQLRVVQKEGPNRGKQFLACSERSCKHMEWPK